MCFSCPVWATLPPVFNTMKLSFTFPDGTTALVTLTPRQEAIVEHAADIANDEPTEAVVSLIVEAEETITAPSPEWLAAHKRTKATD